MPATSARIYSVEGRCASLVVIEVSRSRWYRRRESPVFRNVNVPVEAPLARLMSTISARTCNWDNASRLSVSLPLLLLYYSFSRYSGLFIVFKRGSLNGRVRIPPGVYVRFQWPRDCSISLSLPRAVPSFLARISARDFPLFG